jgi:hypothetical protein
MFWSLGWFLVVSYQAALPHVFQDGLAAEQSPVVATASIALAKTSGQRN